MERYHVPVLLSECMDGLAVREGGVYVDATFGGGGHSRAIMERLGDGQLFGFDQDSDARANVPDDERFRFVNANFRHLKNFLRYAGVGAVDGILADLGVSSHHLDDGQRGFSFRHVGPLDMRMNRAAGLTAADVLNGYGADVLLGMFRSLGEVDNAGCLVKEIMAHRKVGVFDRIENFMGIISRCVDKRHENKYLAKVFQALRMEVNGEMEVLSDFLAASVDLLKPGGRLVVLTYHSLEDRLVKQFVKWGGRLEEMDSDVYGHRKPLLLAVNKKVILAPEEEIARNSRARSAKLRIAEKV